MKTSCIPICLFQKITSGEMSFVEWLDMAAEVGLDGIEMYDRFLESFESDHLNQVAEQVKERGLEISMLTGYGDLARPEGLDAPPGGTRADAIAEVKRNVDASLILGTEIVRVVGGMWPKGVDRDAALTNVADGLQECLAYATPKGILLGFEDHPEVGTAIGDFVEIIRRVDSDDLKVNLDTSNPLVSGDDPVELTELVQDRVIHLHVSDRHADLEHSITGQGAVDFPAIFQILKEAGFDGWFSMEAGGPPEKKSVADGLEYMKRTWQEA